MMGLEIWLEEGAGVGRVGPALNGAVNIGFGCWRQ